MTNNAAAPITSTTTDREVRVTALRALDLDFLSRIPVGTFGLRGRNLPGWWEAEQPTPAETAAEWTAARLDSETCVIAYEGEFGIAVGVARCRRPAGYGGRTEDTFEVSPFPGAWEEVPLSKVVTVRHAATI